MRNEGAKRSFGIRQDNRIERRHALGKIEEPLTIKTRKNWGKYSKTSVVVARGRLELPSGAPEAPMIATTPPGYGYVML